MSAQHLLDGDDVLAHIDGRWVSGPETRPNLNPADTRQIVGQSAHCGRAEAQAAIEAAACVLLVVGQ